VTRGGPAPTKGNRAEDAAAVKPHNVSSQGTAGADSPARLLRPLIGYVTGGLDRPALDRLRTAARHGALLVDRGAERTGVVLHLVLAAEIVGVGRHDAEAVVRAALGGAR
jgi:hypothetical protein